MSKHEDIPVYKIKPVGDNRVRTIHRNLLKLCNELALDVLEKPIHRKEKVRKGVISVEDSEDELVIMVKRNEGDTHVREEGREDQGREDQGREDQGREDQGREDQGREDQGREDQGREDQGREDQGREDQGREDQGREDQGREDQGREDQGREDQGRDNREDQGREDQGREDQGRDNQVVLDFDDGMGESEPGEEVGCWRSARNRKLNRIFTYNKFGGNHVNEETI